MKFTKKRIGYVPATESLEQTLEYGCISQKNIKDLANCLMSKKGAKREAEELTHPEELINPVENKGVVKRQIKITVEIKDLSNKRGKK